MKSPFPWFGGKSRVAGLVWSRFGNVPNYVEPFFGSGAVLLARTGDPKIETVNDLDGFVANFWRALQHDPEAVAHWADNPVNENDLHARHVWLVNQKETLVRKLEGDPDFYDPRIAGYWVWGIACWIGSGFCSGEGPWQVNEAGELENEGSASQGVNRKLVHLGNAGRGVNRQHNGLRKYMQELADRLRNVRVCSGDWSRVCTPSVTFKHGVTGVFLDPPYADTADRTADLYTEDCLNVAHDVRRWAIANGENPLMRIALCGYEGEHEMPDSWDCVAWKASGGYSARGSKGESNSHRERIWFSPHCQKTELF